MARPAKAAPSSSSHRRPSSAVHRPTRRFDLTVHADRTLKAQEALHAASWRLCQLGYTPLLCGPDAQCPYDLRADRPASSESFRIQVKYSTDGLVATSARCRRATARDFDFYALYLAPIETIVFVHRRFAGKKIRYTLPNSAARFFWYDDFTAGFTDSAPRRSLADFGQKVRSTRRGIPNPSGRKGQYPTTETLKKLLERNSVLALSKTIGVSDTALRKHCRRHGIPLPSLGAWVRPTSRGLARPPYVGKRKLDAQPYNTALHARRRGDAQAPRRTLTGVPDA